jgi:hypothetical protein
MYGALLSMLQIFSEEKATRPSGAVRGAKVMADLRDPRILHFKGWLFFVLGLLATLLIALKTQDWQVIALLTLAVWAFCRWYYYAFYVIQNYIAAGYRYPGLLAFLKDALRGKLPTDTSSNLSVISPEATDRD